MLHGEPSLANINVISPHTYHRHNSGFSRGIIEIVNKMDRPLKKLGLSTGDLSVKPLLDAACRQTKLSDWGDESFIEGLETLARSFQAEANLNLIGKMNEEQEMMRRLTNRLYIQRLLTDHPEIKERPISRPLFILGLPRTGTTLLHRLLMQDAAVRAPLLWELLRPAPSNAGQSDNSKSRIRAAEWLVRGQKLFMPGLDAIHSLEAHEPDECIFVLQNSMYYAVRGHIPTYMEWLRQHDMVADYQYYKQTLQVLDWQRSAPCWVLKSPYHLLSLDALLEVFPDACIVQLHRDPKKVIPSWCSLVREVQQVSSLNLNEQRIGQTWVDVWSEGMAHALHVREGANRAQFYDIYYDNLVRDPVGEVARLYRYFDFPWNADTEQSMCDWLALDRKKRKHVHDYSLEQYGLTPQSVDERFHFYTNHFDIL